MQTSRVASKNTSLQYSACPKEKEKKSNDRSTKFKTLVKYSLHILNP